jgi:hypothetical protein
MQSKLASLFVEILGDDKPLNRTLAGVHKNLLGLAGVGLRAGRGVGGGLLRGASGAFGALGSLAGKAISRGALVAGGAGAFGLGKALAGGSDLAETQSKVGEVFRDQADQVQRAADDMAKAFGTPKREMLDAASQFGLISQGMGMARKESAGFAVSMAKLAADASSFYNISNADALEKIRAGLTGESEPLKALGVIMTEDAVKAEAMRMGLAKAGAELSNSAKLAARSAIIQRGLSAASGDLERTQAGAANQSRKFWGTLENLGDTIGQQLLPAFTDLLGVANETLTGMADSLATGQGAFAGFVGFVKGGIDTVSFVWRNFGDVIGLVGVNAAEAWLNMGERIMWLGDASRAFLDWFSNNWRTIIPEALDAVWKAASNFGDNFASLIKEVYDYLRSGFTDPIEIKFKPLLEGFDAKTPGLQLPELNLTSLDDQRKPFLDNVANREGERERKKAEDAKKVAAPRKPDEKVPDAPAKKKGGITDLAGFAKELQLGAFGKGNAAERTARGVEKAVQKLDVIAKKPVAVNGPGYAAGPA